MEVGDKVKWINRDGSRHDAMRTDAPAFATGLLAKDQESPEIVFSTASGADGFDYSCTPHSFMVAKVIVVLPGTNVSSFSRSAAQLAHATKSARE